MENNLAGTLLGKKITSIIVMLLAFIYSPIGLSANTFTGSDLNCNASTTTELPLVLQTTNKNSPAKFRVSGETIPDDLTVNVIDFRYHNIYSNEIILYHNSLRGHIMQHYEQNGIVSNKVRQSFYTGLDANRRAPISYYYLSRPQHEGGLFDVTVKFVRFSKSDFHPTEMDSTARLRNAFEFLPRFDLERKSKEVLPEHLVLTNGKFAEDYAGLVKDLRKEATSPEQRAEILKKLYRMWQQIPDSAFQIAEITGVTSLGKTALGYDGLGLLMDRVIKDAKLYGVKRLYLLATNPSIAATWKRRGFVPFKSYIDDETKTLKTKMYLDL